jgi:hypothetical protein
MLELLIDYDYIREYIETNQNNVLTNFFYTAAKYDSEQILDFLLNNF